MAAFLDVCRFVANAAGTGDFVYSTAVQGYQSPALAGAVNGRLYKYRAESANLAEWEVGEGAYTSGTFARTTVLFNSAGTTGKINFTLAPQVAVVALKEDLISIEEANVFTAAQQAQARSNIGIATVLHGYISGLILSTAGSSATFSVAPGVAADSSSTDIMVLSAVIAKTTSAWAAGSTNGGLDTGSIANNTWYHVYLIKRPDTGVVDVLISTSASSPTMPTNYTLKRRIGSLRTNGSGQWMAFNQYGDDFFWSASIIDVSGQTTHTAAVLRTMTVPTGIQVKWIGHMGIGGADNNGTVTSPDQVDTAPGNLVGQYRNGGAVLVAVPAMPIYTDTSARIRTRFDAATGFYNISTWGWIDTRGKDS